MTRWEVLLAIAALIAVVLLARSLCAWVTVYSYQKGLRFRRGRMQGLVAPGLYLVWRHFSEIRTVDARNQLVTIPGQEIVSADGVAIKLSLAAKFAVTDAERALLGTSDYQAGLYLEIQNCARQVIGSATAEDLLAKRAELAARVLDLARPKLKEIGLDLAEVAIKDCVLPGEFKKLFAQVVKARQEGLAQLERARGETAALRSLVNAAQLIEKHPAVLQLRQLQVFSDAGSHSLILGAHPAPIESLKRGGRRPDAAAEPDRGDNRDPAD
jgi:regulator of protease activity HflC (stomatin/prohibitin superfamily)